MWDQSLLELFYRGGFVMWPLLGCSILALAIILDKTLFFLRIRFNSRHFHQQLEAFVRNKQLRQAADYSRGFQHPVPRITAVYLDYVQQPENLRLDIIKREGSLELERVSRRLRALAAITHIAPLIGLLGTVAGMVTAFAQIQTLGGVVNASDLAGGIWEALLTTVFGLSIAIPCMAAYHSFESAADKISRRMEFAITTLDEWYGKKTDQQLKSDTGDEELAAIR